MDFKPSLVLKPVYFLGIFTQIGTPEAEGYHKLLLPFHPINAAHYTCSKLSEAVKVHILAHSPQT